VPPPVCAHDAAYFLWACASKVLVVLDLIVFRMFMRSTLVAGRALSVVEPTLKSLKVMRKNIGQQKIEITNFFKCSSDCSLLDNQYT
jgi:hypothetical protein